MDGEGNVTQAMTYPLATDASRAPDRFRSFLFGSSGLFDSADPAHPGLVRVDNVGILSACDEYGVVRTAVMRSVTPLGSYHHADRIVVCELALRGKFHITPEWLYFRRDNDDRTYNLSSKLRGRCEIMDPARKNRLLHPTVRLVGEYLLGYVRAIHGAPISASDKRECYRYLAQWALDRTTSKVVPREEVPIVDRLAADDHRDRGLRTGSGGRVARVLRVSERCGSSDPGNVVAPAQRDSPGGREGELSQGLVLSGVR